MTRTLIPFDRANRVRCDALTKQGERCTFFAVVLVDSHDVFLCHGHNQMAFAGKDVPLHDFDGRSLREQDGTVSFVETEARR
jgi:hypothetical protein